MPLPAPMDELRERMDAMESSWHEASRLADERVCGVRQHKRHLRRCAEVVRAMPQREVLQRDLSAHALAGAQVQLCRDGQR